MTRFVFAFWFAAFKLELAAIDDYVVKQWNIQSGLPSQSVKSVYKTSRATFG